VVAQFLAFVAVLATMGGVIMYLSRPPSADKLYNEISARVDSGDDLSLSKVEEEVDDFLERFPADSRADLLRGYKERIELDKLERKLQRQARSGGTINTSLLPAEQLFLEAASLAATAPEKAIAMLNSLVALYDVEAPIDTDNAMPSTSKETAKRKSAERTADVVQLAKRRIKSLQADLAQQREQQMAALNERLAAAERLKATYPQKAMGIYEAILNLHEKDAWAAGVVKRARDGLTELGKK